MNTPSTPQPQVDFVILTPLGEERDAVLARLPEYRQLPPTYDDIRVHYAAELPVTFSDGSATSYSIIVTPLAKMGHTEASAVTSDVIHRWKPRYVLLVGIAGGMEKAGVKLGDVLISDQVADYELAKVTVEKSTIRWQVHRVDQRLLIAAQNFHGNQWHATKSRRYDKQVPQVHFGPICTGNKVVADEGLASQFQDVWAKLVGVEMEAGGVANAALQSADHLGFFMIRGVSDLADGKKGSSSVERWRPYAREIAAAWAIEFLKSGPVPPVAVAPLDSTAAHSWRESVQPATIPELALPIDQLLEQLKRLPSAQFEELVFRYDSNTSVPGRSEAQSVRAIELLKVMRTREGGLPILQAELQRLRHGGR